MSKIASQVPKRNPSGYTPQPPYGPWADCGAGDPFFYQEDYDDFNYLATGGYTTSAGGAGSVALSAGGGGYLLFTTAGATNNFESIQRGVGNVVVPTGTDAGKKLFYGARAQISDITNSAFILGLCDITATPFAGITDGIWFSKASGSTQVVLNISTSSVNLATNVVFTLVAATEFDVAFYVDRYGNVQYSIGAQLFGWIPQSGTGAASVAPEYYSSLPVLCPTGKLYSGNQPTTTASGYTLPTANLSLTAGVQTGANAAKTMTLNFHGLMRER
jgi:hypothetical protein